MTHPLIQIPGPRVMPIQERIVAFVDSNGTNLEGYTDFINDNLVKTLEEAMPRVTAEGDTIVCMMGHAEDVAVATFFDNFVAGTRVVGMGSPEQSNAPTFTWTAGAAAGIIAVADVTLQNLRFDMGGANPVALGIGSTAAGTKVLGNYFQLGTSAALETTVAISINGDDATIRGNILVSSGGALCEDAVILGAAADGLVIEGNWLDLETTTDSGSCIGILDAATNLLLRRNIVQNRRATGTTCIAFSDDASNGLCDYNLCSVANDGVASAQGIVLAGTTNLNVRFNENYCSDEPGLSGILSPPVVAT